MAVEPSRLSSLLWLRNEGVMLAETQTVIWVPAIQWGESLSKDRRKNHLTMMAEFGTRLVVAAMAAVALETMTSCSTAQYRCYLASAIHAVVRRCPKSLLRCYQRLQ